MAMIIDDILHLSNSELDRIMDYLKSHNLIDESYRYGLDALMRRGMLVREYAPLVLG